MTNKCGNCQWLVTSEGKPYYCAIKDLYTIRMLSTNACEDFLEAEQCPIEAKVCKGDKEHEDRRS